jgi:HPt (histidine-containing phosphotransfer) domain-containing protein
MVKGGGLSVKKDKITVRLDPDIQDLIPGFLDNRKKDVTAIRTALANGDFATITVLGHTMKGDGGGYGFDDISEIGALIETAGKQKNADKIKQGLDRLADFLERVEVVF